HSKIAAQFYLCLAATAGSGVTCKAASPRGEALKKCNFYSLPYCLQIRLIRDPRSYA
ncbi:hypothetical protein AMTR_s00343p00004460, partial [Amborella trichopoda]